MTGLVEPDLPCAGPTGDAPALPVVFLGPSMPLDEARGLINAEYRPPVRRGDLDDVAPGTLVAIIDGVFEQALAVSPAEIARAIARGVQVVGGGSMGALRASEVPGMTGVGRICEWYCSGRLDRDEEVALIFDPRSGRPLSVPLVNVRYAADCLNRLGTIDTDTARAIVATASRLSFKDRTYPVILAAAGLGDRIDTVDLAAMLESHDLKRSDAQAVLEWVDRAPIRGPQAEAPSSAPDVGGTVAGPSTRALIWETGDAIEHADLVEFMLLSGALDAPLRKWTGVGEAPTSEDAQRIIVETSRRWGWVSAEEAQVTLADLGLDTEAVGDACAREAASRLTIEAEIFRGAAPDGLLADLLLEGLDLKRAVLVLGSLRHFAARAGDEPPSAEELRIAGSVWARVNGVARLPELARRWQRRGLDQARIDAAVDLVARARRAAAPLAERMRKRAGGDRVASGTARFPLAACPKPSGEARFARSIVEAEPAARALAARMGITRIGMIGELSEFMQEDGIHIAQAARPGGAWSSSYGSGKARSAAGAVVGSVIEEVEKWAQELFAPEPTVRASFASLAASRACVDPATLDLPHDSSWHPQAPIDWIEAEDLIGGESVLVPLDPLRIRRTKHDICYSPRATRKHLATNGLGAGFAREEACLHGLCELVERHAQRLAELFLSNPGGIGGDPYAFISADCLGPSVASLARVLARTMQSVRLLDITGDIAIPTFMATLVRDYQRAEGFGTHPNPAVAAEMALLEAAQTISSQIAGGREDLSIRARSLGRHERPRPVDTADSWFWLDSDMVPAEAPRCAGFISGDVRDDLLWSLEQVRSAGIARALVVDLTPPEAAPAHAVRMIVPGIESNNPFHVGERARLVVARAFLPRWR